ncbi:hypothetical protein KXV68_003398 [Aspergillus fumigatus]|nr:hypothetical protein KXX67_004860 [Aspergillus fumigatus]KAH2146725.1 hypothetical protein KXV68_003398 [Aspergillus fumigatus]KAH2347899.1 hypothetical protein KXW91_004781 [Aspergillus fumigatus]KAH2825536.1 hypothetical protein KXW76_002597 [Aspergillus fumigatus]KAH3289892.1 hypothetical protein KXW74_005213 [Aspergillus fumigatus]
MSLIPIICTHEVSPTVITSILSTAYKASSVIDSPPNLIVIMTADAAELQEYTDDSVTKLPVESLQYPFLGWDIGKIAQFLQENTSDTIVDYTTFLVADEKTALDEDTLLLVYDVEGLQESIRLSACFANSEAVSVSVATKDVGELWTLADEDGVYRGGPQHPPPKKGGKAPRKRL